MGNRKIERSEGGNLEGVVDISVLHGKKISTVSLDGLRCCENALRCNRACCSSTREREDTTIAHSEAGSIQNLLLLDTNASQLDLSVGHLF